MIAPRQPPIGSAQRGVGLLRNELNREVLVLLAGRPMTEAELADRLVVSSRETLRKHLGELSEGRAVERREPDGARGAEYVLTDAGIGLVELLELASGWLDSHPRPEVVPASPLSWRAFGALADSWQAAVVEALAHGPRSEEELCEAIDGLGSGKVERELRRMLGAGVVRPTRGSRSNGRYALTDWGRRGIGVLAASARWEALHLGERAEPVTVRDAQVALLIALPLVPLPRDATGLCSFTVELDPGLDLSPRSGAVWVRVKGGRLTRAGEGAAPSPPDAWVRGPVGAWFEAVLDGRAAALQYGGRQDLMRSLLGGLHSALYGDE